MTPRSVAIFNSNDDLVEILRMALEAQGFVVASGHITAIKRGRLDLPAFLAQHQPDVILYDLAPPYEQAWNLLQRLRSERGPLSGYRLLLTTTNSRRVEELLGVNEAFELVGKPYDLEAIVEAVRRQV